MGQYRYALRIHDIVNPIRAPKGDRGQDPKIFVPPKEVVHKIFYEAFSRLEMW